MKLLKRKILFALACGKDFFFKKDFSYHSYGYLYPRLSPFKRSSVRDACLQLVETGEIDRIMRNNQVIFRLTAQGRAQLLEFFPQITRFKKSWDIVWRIAIISSYMRKKSLNKTDKMGFIKLRKELSRLGFRPISRGVYLSPLITANELKDYILQNKLSRQVLLLESKKLLVGDNAMLGYQLWGLEKLHEEYTKFITRAASLLRQTKSKKALQDQEKIEFFQIMDQFFCLLLRDPALPSKLTGSDWPLLEAKDLFFKLSKHFILLENA